MGEVLDRWRINQGWNPYDPKTQDLAIQSWVAILDKENVPPDAYAELYEWALSTRALAIQSGKQLPNFGVELLLAGWIGENGLQRQRAQQNYDRMVRERRTLGTADGLSASPIIPFDEGVEMVNRILAKKAAER